MRVTAGSLTDADRAILIESNLDGRSVCVHARGDCWVGVVKTWDHDTLTLAGWSFESVLGWREVVGVWWRDEAPEPCPFDCASTTRAAASSEERS